MANQIPRQVFPTITGAFLNRVRNQPDRPVFHVKEGTEWKAVTWREYYENVRLISLGLVSLGVRPGENVCLISNTRLEWAACDMAILGARAVTVPIYASNMAEDCAYIINHCGAKVVFVEDSKQIEKLLSVKDKLPPDLKIIPFTLIGSPEFAGEKSILSLAALRELGKRQANGKNDDQFEKNLSAAKPSDVFTICYTSGTTGVPKGVVLTHDSLTSVLEDVDHVLGEHASEDDVVLSFLPASHIFGKVESMAAYHFGWQTYYAESIEKLFVNIGEVRPTLLFAVPRVFEKAFTRIKASIDESSTTKRRLFGWAMAAGKEYFSKIWSGKTPSPLNLIEYRVAKALVFSKVYQKFGGRMRFCIAGGAPLPREIGEFMQILGIPILEGYGLTETCAPVTLNPMDAPRFGSIGKPLPEVAIKVADDGEILVKSRKVFREYYKNPDATADTIDREGWLHTGDIGVIDNDGYVRITDRKKDLIVTSGGKNIAPQKIENMAKTSKYISQFMVYGDRRNYLSALIVLDKEQTVKFAKENNILFSEFPELVKNPKIQSLVQGILDEINRGLASFESVKRFKILPNEFTIETGELTPSMKIRRRFCSEKYRNELDSMYGGVAAR